MIKSIYTCVGNFIGRGQFSVNNIGVTNDGEFFTFPVNSSLNHLMSIRVLKETAYDNLAIRFRLTARNVTSSSRIGILFKNATDGYDGERQSFVIGDGVIAMYQNNTKSGADFANFSISSLNNKTFDIEMTRINDSYGLNFKGNSYSRVVAGDGGSFKFRQNINACVYGSGCDIRIDQVQYRVNVIQPKFGLVGDSIANGYSSGTGASWANTIKGVNVANGLFFTEFAGSANVIKDTLDSFNDLAVVKPKYVIIMYGHNDTLFNTGRLETDYKQLVLKIKEYGMIPIICTMPYSAWIDITIPNNFIRANYFNDDYIHIELADVLDPPAPGPDYNDIAHPTVQGNIKLGEAIYDTIKDLP